MNILKCASLSLAAAGLVAMSASAAPPPGPGVQRDLAELRQATARFHQLDRAFIAGWTQDITGCLSSPEGGMGYHFANFGALMDGGQVEALRPEFLVYAPDASGGLRLVAAEYFVPAADLPDGTPVPVLFGETFHFNPHVNAWVLHAWVWQHNPGGMFADWNPDVSCD